MVEQHPFAVSPNARPGAAEVESPPPPPGLKFNELEQALWDQLCLMLRKARIEHITAGLAIAMVVVTYRQLLDALALCEKHGRAQKAKSGWYSPFPWAEDEKRLKMELGQWMPKACLTIPALTRVRKDMGDQGGQDDLFGDLVQHGQSSPQSGLPN